MISVKKSIKVWMVSIKLRLCDHTSPGFDLVCRCITLTAGAWLTV